MRRRKLGFGTSSAVSVSLGIAIVTACNVYDSSLLTGGSEGQGGTAAVGTGGGGDSGTGAGGTGGKGGSLGGGTGGTSGTGMDGGDGGTDPTGGTGTGGSTGGTSGGTTGGGGKGGSSPTGGDAGDTSTGGKGGTGTGGTAGMSAGDGGSGPSGGTGGSGGSGGNAGSGGACGKCGCGKAETPDTDNDGVLDCNDMCPDFNDADCAALKSGLVHRYSFNGAAMSTTVTDTKGTANGTAMGTNVGLSGTGTLVLAGGGTATADPKQYVDLPDNLLSGLTNATFEAFITWAPDAATASNNQWHRVFDFGSASTATTGSYIFLTPKIGTSATSGCRLAIATAGSQSETAAGGAQANGPAVAAGGHHLVVIVDDANDTVSLYVDGTLGSTVGFTGALSAINSVNNWLGRSNYSVDRYFAGTYDEFRVYNVALTPAQLRTSRTAGPNATFF